MAAWPDFFFFFFFAWPDLEKKETTICFATRTLFDRLNFTGGEDPNSRLLLCFEIVLKEPRFVASDNVPDATSSSCVEFLQHSVCSIRPELSSALKPSCEAPNGRNVSRRRDDHGDFGSHFSMKCPVSHASLRVFFWGLP